MNFNRMQNRNNQPNNNQDDIEENGDVQESSFDLSKVWVDTNEDGETTFSMAGDEDEGDVTATSNTQVQPTQKNNVPQNNFNIAQTPEYQQLHQAYLNTQQAHQQTQNQLIQLAQYIKQKETPDQEPDWNEIMSDPNKFKEYTQNEIKKGVQESLKAVQPQMQQVNQVVQKDQAQNHLNEALNVMNERYSDFSDVLNTNQARALELFNKYKGSLPDVYSTMKNELKGSPKPTSKNTRKQNIQNVEYGGNSQTNNVKTKEVVHDRDPARNSVIKAMNDAFNKRS